MGRPRPGPGKRRRVPGELVAAVLGDARELLRELHHET